MASVTLVDDTTIRVRTIAPSVVVRTIDGAEVHHAEGDYTYINVPWTYDNTCILAELDIPYLSPITRDFDFSGPYQPKTHQLLICNIATMNKRGYCFADMGLGKTASLIWTASYLRQIGKINRVLVVCPKVVMRAAWVHELAMLAPYDTVAVLDGDAKRRRRELARDAMWDVVNYEGLEILEKELQSKHYDMVIVDESTMVKNPSTKRWNFLDKITSRTERVWLLTASPTPQGPMDAHGQLLLLAPQAVPAEFYAFRNMVMEIGRPSFKTRGGQTVPPEWVAKPDANDILKRYFIPAIRLDKADWVQDLPEIYDIYHEVPLSAEQTKAIKSLQQLAIKAATDDEAVAGGIVAKLYQISSGSLYKADDAGEREVEHFDMQPRVDAVIALIEEAKARHTGDFIGGKTLIYVSHRHICDRLYKELSTRYNVGKVIGGTNNRSDILHAFEKTDEIEVLVAVSSAMSHGVTAIAANTIIWFTPALSTEVFIQAGERTHRIGQRQEGRRYYLFSTTAERERHEHLQRGTAVQHEMLSLYKTFVES